MVEHSYLEGGREEVREGVGDGDGRRVREEREQERGREGGSFFCMA